MRGKFLLDQAMLYQKVNIPVSVMLQNIHWQEQWARAIQKVKVLLYDSTTKEPIKHIKVLYMGDWRVITKPLEAKAPLIQ